MHTSVDDEEYDEEGGHLKKVAQPSLVVNGIDLEKELKLVEIYVSFFDIFFRQDLYYGVGHNGGAA